jgi:hypothetical protein
MKRELYPANWPEISQRIRERAGNRCERCGVSNHAVGARDASGTWHDISEIERMGTAGVYNTFGENPPAPIKIILTVAHLDQDPSHNDDSNLAALCQRCHLNHDRPWNLVKRHQTVLRKHENALAAAGQLRLEGVL